MSERFDLIVDAGWIIPRAQSGQTLADHSIAVRDGLIVALAPQAESASWTSRERVSLSGHALLPGLVNTHGHAAMTLLRGFAEDLPLNTWLEQRIWPAEAQHVSRTFVRDGAALAIVEMLRAGITTSSDMYFFPEETAAQAEALGLRMQLAFPIIDVSTAWARDAEECLHRGIELYDRCKHSPTLSIAFGPHSTYAVSRSALERTAMLAAELDRPVHIHLHETANEVAEQMARSGQRPLALLDEIGLLGPNTQCVHMVHLNAQDFDRLQQQNAKVVHCPRSNMKLASGSCPLSALRVAGITTGLGTDGAASNNSLSILAEIQAAAQLARIREADTTAINAASLLHMATLGGAEVLGLDAQIGSLELGKLADMIAVDLTQPETQPVYDPVATLSYAASASLVTDVWVGGAAALRDRQLVRGDVSGILQRAQEWRARIQRN